MKNPSPAKVEKLVAQVLDEAKSKPKFQAARERDALINAVCHDQSSIVDCLLARGITSDMPDSNGRTALWYAAHWGRGYGLIRALVEAGAKLPDDVLIGPVHDCDAKTVRFLVKRGANVNCAASFTRYSRQFPEKRIPLAEAIKTISARQAAERNSRVPLSQRLPADAPSIPIMLIKAGAEVNRLAFIAPVSRTMLGLAAFSGLTKTVKAMLAAGADVNMKDTWGGTALIDAAERGHQQIVRILLSAGAKANVKRKDGFTAASIAREHGFGDLADEIERHARP